MFRSNDSSASLQTGFGAAGMEIANVGNCYRKSCLVGSFM